MKKLVSYIVFTLLTSVSICFGQNEDINIKYLHSEAGKNWEKIVRIDGEAAPSSLHDDVLIFFSDGTFKYNHSGTVPKGLENAKTKTWTYSAETNILKWEFYLANGTIKKYSGEITYLDQNRLIMNFSEEGKDNYIAAFSAF